MYIRYLLFYSIELQNITKNYCLGMGDSDGAIAFF